MDTDRDDPCCVRSFTLLANHPIVLDGMCRNTHGLFESAQTARVLKHDPAITRQPEKSLLNIGMPVAVTQQTGDSALTAQRILVGKDGMTPPM